MKGLISIYRIALCDDDAVFTQRFQTLLAEVMDSLAISYELCIHLSADALARALESKQSFRLIFLDIFLGEKNGVAFARRLREEGHQTDLVFITVSRDFAVEGYDVFPLSYLLKPVTRDKLEKVVRRALAHAPNRLVFPTKRGLIAAALDDILYAEIYDRTIYLHKTDGSKDTFTGTLSDLENELPPLHFVRCHKSYLVNMAHISRIVRYAITLTGNIKIPIGKNRYNEVQDSFIDFAQQNSPTFL